jgi:hypothetical protein
MKKIICIFFCFGLLINSNSSIVLAQQKERAPKTYTEAIDGIIKNLDKESLNTLKNTPRFLVSAFSNKVYELDFINIRDIDLLQSSAKSIGLPHVHFEDLISVLLRGVWDKLNADLEITNFDAIQPEQYFDAIQNTIHKGMINKQNGYLASLPYWVWDYENFENYSKLDSIKQNKIIDIAFQLANMNSGTSYLGLMYFVKFSNNRKQKQILLDHYYNIDNQYFEVPFYQNEDSIIETSKDKVKRVSVIHYKLEKISCKDFALKGFEFLYDKKISTYDDYQKFLNYCNNNYIAKWKYLKSPTVDEYKELLTNPRQLLEILILSDHYYYLDIGYHQLVQGENYSVKELVDLMEASKSLSDWSPYDKRLESDNFEETAFSFKPVNALVAIANRLSVEELLSIVNPKSIEAYNTTYKTDDLLDYKYLVSFILATQYKRLLNYSDKNIIYEAYYYYWDNEHVSWPFQYFIADMLIQIDQQRAEKMFKGYFDKDPSDGSFTRQGILSSIIRYDFENNIDFIENWYWTVQSKNFNYSPHEHQLILDLLLEKDDKTKQLYNKITHSSRFRAN